MSPGMKQACVSARGIFWMLTLCALAGVACSAGGGGMVPDAHPVDAYEVSLDLPAGCPPEAGNEKGVGKPCTVGGNECPNNGTLQCTCDPFLGIKLVGVPCFCTLVTLNTGSPDAGDRARRRPRTPAGATRAAAAICRSARTARPTSACPAGYVRRSASGSRSAHAAAGPRRRRSSCAVRGRRADRDPGAQRKRRDGARAHPPHGHLALGRRPPGRRAVRVRGPGPPRRAPRFRGRPGGGARARAWRASAVRAERLVDAGPVARARDVRRRAQRPRGDAGARGARRLFAPLLSLRRAAGDARSGPDAPARSRVAARTARRHARELAGLGHAARRGAVPIPYEGVDEPFIDLEHGRTAAVLLDDIIVDRYEPRHPTLRVAVDRRQQVAVGGTHAIAYRPSPTSPTTRSVGCRGT